MSGDKAMILIIFGFTIFIATVAIFLQKYKLNHKTNFDVGAIIIGIFFVLIAVAYYFIKSIGGDERERIIKNITLQTTINTITFDKHKPYFKYMTLADSQYLPMPEAMNNTLQIGDSIYKNRGENFYTVINAKTKTISKYEVKIHERILTKP